MNYDIPADALKLELARRSLLDFTTYTKPNYVVNWHHKVIAEAIDRLLFGDLKRLMIFCPPRHGKSELVSRRLPAYAMGRCPGVEVILASYSADLANKMNGDIQGIMDSPRYKKVFPHVRLPGGVGDPLRKLPGGKKKRTEGYFELMGSDGSLRSAGVGVGITGMGMSLGIIDDPFKDAEEAQSQVIRDKVWDWYQTTFGTRETAVPRQDDLPGEARILLTMTRWHDDDLAGRLLKLAKENPDAEQWEVICLPAVLPETYDDQPAYDTRTWAGQPLWETSNYGVDFMRRKRAGLPSYFWLSMYMQRPKPDGGGHFQRSRFFRYRFEGEYLIRAGAPPVHMRDGYIVAAVDPAASEEHRADFTAIVVLFLAPDGFGYVLDVVRERYKPERIPDLMHRVDLKWHPNYFLFEATGFQTAVIKIARDQYPDMAPIREAKLDGKGKLVRSSWAVAKNEQGLLGVPADKVTSPWVEAFFDELEAFSGLDDKHDDQVDALAHACNQFGRQGTMAWADTVIGAVKPWQKARPQQAPAPNRSKPSAASRRKLWGR